MAIKTVPLFKDLALGSGSSGQTSASDFIDCREAMNRGSCSLTYRVGAAGGLATAATVNFLYQVASFLDGTGVFPLTGDKGTIGTAGSGLSGSMGVLGFSPVVAPWMKILAIAGTSGTAMVSAELHLS